MGKRSTGRKLAMQALYQAEIRNVPIEEIIDGFLEDGRYIDETIKWATFLATQTWVKREDMDKIIEKYSIGWDLDRISPIDKSLLRIALYEIVYESTSPNVVINEVIEMAKRYSQEESPKFLNGILGEFIKKECLQE